MITEHHANSRWWGSPVGTVDDPAFFDLDSADQRLFLRPFAWVEFKSRISEAPSASALSRAGFSWIDVQVPFRIALRSLSMTESLRRYECVSASQDPFSVESRDMREFADERFTRLPGVTPERLSARYVDWANDLIARDPGSCLRLSLNGTTQGWFLSESSGAVIQLTLAMLASGASVSGQHLYHRCLLKYAESGSSVGQASFSVRNSRVMNVYASLGAHFTVPHAIWAWVAPAQEG